MNCAQFEPLIHARVEAEAVGPRGGRACSAAAARRLEAHLERCGACRRTLREARALRALLRAQSTHSAPAGFEARVAARLPAGAGAGPVTAAALWERLRLRWEWRTRVPALAAAGSLAAALLAFQSTPYLSRPDHALPPAGEQLVRAPAVDAAYGADWEALQASVELSAGIVVGQ
jgi:anti-sigma factor RsiW